MLLTELNRLYQLRHKSFGQADLHVMVGFQTLQQSCEAVISSLSHSLRA